MHTTHGSDLLPGTSVRKEEGKLVQVSVEFCLFMPNPNLSIVHLQVFCIDYVTPTVPVSSEP